MTVSTSFLPTLVTIPAGALNGVAIDSFRLGQTPITNAQYAAHVNRYLNRPFVFLQTDPWTHATSVFCRAKTPEEVIGDLAKRFLKNWNNRDPFLFGVFTLIKLRKDMSLTGFDRPNQPVVGVSWFHAFEYCVSNGLFLPTDDQWEYAARGPEGHEYGTLSGRLIEEEAHYGAKMAPANVGSYPPNGFGLQEMTGNVAEWTARNPREHHPYGLRGGSWGHGDDPDKLLAAYRSDGRPDICDTRVGFRVAAAP
jgi:formylglycine-generating enzyme required for sulfatase activity